MTIEEKIDALTYMCKKIGFEIKTPLIHLNYHFCNIMCLGYTVDAMPCIENANYACTYPNPLNNSIGHVMPCFLLTKIFNIQPFNVCIQNPYFNHYDLMNCISLDVFKVEADLVFPDDMSDKVIAYIDEKIQNHIAKMQQEQENAYATIGNSFDEIDNENVSPFIKSLM